MTSKESAERKKLIKKYHKAEELSKKINKADPRQAITMDAITNRLGPGAYGAQLHIPWNRVFGEDLCPCCQTETMTEKKDIRLCMNCGFRVANDLYQESQDREKLEEKWRKEMIAIQQKAKEIGVDLDELRDLYNQVVSKKEESKKKKR